MVIFCAEFVCVCVRACVYVSVFVCRYPGDLAWSVPLSKKFIRKSPLVSKFHAFLVRENEQVTVTYL